MRRLPPSRRRGSALIEFGIAAAVLIPVFGGTFKLGYSMYAYNLLESSVSNGARYAYGRTYRSMSTASVDKGKLAIKNMVVYGNPSGGSSPLVKGLTTSNVTVTYSYLNSIPVDVTVSIVNYQVDTFFKTFTFNNKPSVQFPYFGRYAPNEVEP
jgi:Flp pilus assembly protein TadG